MNIIADVADVAEYGYIAPVIEMEITVVLGQTVAAAEVEM